MEDTKIVQLHEIIKNSLATYLSYKWSEDKLYLKKRVKKERKNDNRKKKKSASTVDRRRSVINLENNVFIYDASKKTFTQLDLCDCFKNGVKYRNTDPFAPKSPSKNIELYDAQQKSASDLREYQSYQLVNVKDSVEHIFNNRMIQKENWTKAINDMYPSKFDLFIQKELDKCAGKNFDVKSFQVNTKQEVVTSISNNDKVCSSAAIAGYYTITTYDEGLGCENDINKGRKLSTKQCNFIGIREETVFPKKFYSKGLQCDLSNELQRREKGSKDLGIQCYYYPEHHKHKTRRNTMDNKTHSKCSPSTRQKILPSKKMRKRHGSFSDIFPKFERKITDNTMQLDSSAEIRKILNAQSDSSLSMSNTGQFFRKYVGPKPLLTYYHTSSTSKDHGGDTNDDQYTKNEPIIGMLKASTNEKVPKVNNAKVPNKSGSIRKWGTSHHDRNKSGSINEKHAPHHEGHVPHHEHQDGHVPHHEGHVSHHEGHVSHHEGHVPHHEEHVSHHEGHSRADIGRASYKSGNVAMSQAPDVVAPRKSGDLSPTCSVHCKKYQPGKRSLCTCTYENTRPKVVLAPEPSYIEPVPIPTICASECGGVCAKRSTGTLTCADECPCPGQTIVEKQDPTKPCICPPPLPPMKTCCNCDSVAGCVCQLLCNLRERIRKQTEEQNRNLDQILEELDKQDKEIQLIRQFVEKSRKSKSKHRTCIRKSANCYCYPVTVEYDFNSCPPLKSDILEKGDEIDSFEDDFVEMEPHEPELVKLYGLKKKPEKKKRISEKESWKGIWKKNSKNIFSNELFKKKPNIERKNDSSSSLGHVEGLKSRDKTEKKETKWFSKLVTSKKDLKKTTS